MVLNKNKIIIKGDMKMLKISNPVEEIREVLPQLKDIKNTYKNVKIISYQAWDNRVKTIETKNLNKYKRSLSWSGIQAYFNDCIICVHSDSKVIEINQDKYKIIRDYMMSDEFNLNR